MDSKELKAISDMIKGYEDSLQKLELTVLIFGPGEENTDAYAKACFNKRNQIKQLLTNNKFIAILPEEAHKVAESQGKAPNIITSFEKHLLIEHCDIAIFIWLPNCTGLQHELSAFSDSPECVRKMHCFFATDHPHRWMTQDIEKLIRGGGGRLEDFCKNDVNSCNVSTKVLEIAENTRTFLNFHPHLKYKGVK